MDGFVVALFNYKLDDLRIGSVFNPTSVSILAVPLKLAITGTFLPPYSDSLLKAIVKH